MFTEIYYSRYPNDLTYFYEVFVKRMLLSGELPYRDFNFEYPPGVLIAIAIPPLLSMRYSFTAYFYGFVLMQVLLLLYLFLFLVPSNRKGVFLVLLLLSIPLSLASYDLLPALLVLLSLLTLTTGSGQRSRLFSLFLLSLAAVMKLYPLVFLPIFLFYETFRSALRRLFMFSLFVSFFFVPFALVGGTYGLVYSLTYTVGRGIDLESVLGSAYILGSMLKINTEICWCYGTFHFTSPPMGKPIFFSSLLFVAFSLLCYRRFFKKRVFRREAVFDLAFVLVLTTLIFSKVLSPQYLLWLLVLIPFVSTRLFGTAKYLFPLIVLLTVLERFMFPGYFSNYSKLDYMWPLLLRNTGLVLLWGTTVLSYLKLKASFRIIKAGEGGRGGRKENMG